MSINKKLSEKQAAELAYRFASNRKPYPLQMQGSPEYRDSDNTWSVHFNWAEADYNAGITLVVIVDEATKECFTLDEWVDRKS